MSVQSDCEMMSVDIMEAYAEKHHLSGDEAIKLFHKYQVYEKMMIQKPGYQKRSFLMYLTKTVM